MTNNNLQRAVRRFCTAMLSRDGAGLTDGQLLARFVELRDEAAIEALVRRLGPMVLGVCRRILRHPQDTEDAFQAAFLVLVRKAAAIRSREGVSNWLYGVARNTALRARAARRQLRERQVTEMAEPEARPDDTWNDLLPFLDQELSRLPDKYRAPIVLCDLSGKTYKEAARQLGCPEGTLAGRLTRGRAMLARRMAHHCPPPACGWTALLLLRGAAPPVPAALLAATARAATAFSAGQAASVLSTKVVALTEGVLKTMLLTRLKIGTAVLVTAILACCGIGVMTQTATGRPAESGAAKAKDDKPAEAKGGLQGRWLLVAREENGKRQEYPQGVGVSLSIDDKELVLDASTINPVGRERDGLVTTFGYKVYPDQNPPAIDLLYKDKDGAYNGVWLKGIYKMEDGRLVVVWDKKDRPADFTTKDSEQILSVYKRIEPDKP